MVLTCRKDSNERSSHLFLRVLPPPNLSQLTWKRSCTEKASETRDSDGYGASLSRIKARPGVRGLLFVLAEKTSAISLGYCKSVCLKCIVTTAASSSAAVDRVSANTSVQVTEQDTQT